MAGVGADVFAGFHERLAVDDGVVVALRVLDPASGRVREVVMGDRVLVGVTDVRGVVAASGATRSRSRRSFARLRGTSG